MPQDIPELIASARGFLASQAYGSDERTVLIAVVEQLEKTHAALTPNAETKAAYMGEFQFRFPAHDADGVERIFTPNIPWVTIKEIMAAIVRQAGPGAGQ